MLRYGLCDLRGVPRNAAKSKSSPHVRHREVSEALPRALWTGSLSFGLLNIPVALLSAQEEAPISFALLDRRDFGHVGYRYYNKTTGKEVPRSEIAKGFKYKNGKYVILTDEDFRRANPRAVSAIEIEDFVSIEEVDPMLFDRPYYLVPGKNGEKGYRLLRDVMKETKKAAIGKTVIFRKQHLVAVLARGEYLVLELLRFAREVLTADEMKGFGPRLDSVKISSREIEIAESLVNEMTVKWRPEKYQDTYHEDLERLIAARAKKGGLVKAEEPAQVEEAFTTTSNVVDLMPLLKRSLATGRRKRHAPH